MTCPTFEKCENGVWTQVHFFDLKKGVTFRIRRPDGMVQCDNDGAEMIFTAASYPGIDVFNPDNMGGTIRLTFFHESDPEPEDADDEIQG